MQLSNSLSAYSPQQIEHLGKKVESLVETLRETDKLLNKELGAPSDPIEGDNVYHLDMKPFTEFQRLEKVSMPLHQVIETYDRWNDILWELAHANVGHYKHKKLVLFLIRFRQMVGTVQNFFDPTPEVGN